MFTPELIERATQLLQRLREKGLKLATAESCTGGLVAGLFTEIAGSSDVFDRGFVTYSNAAKHDLLGVPDEMLVRHGAVSEPVAIAMAEGAVARSLADISVAITGVAGPGGGSPDKPVGHVRFASARKGHATAPQLREFGPLSRSDIRLGAVSTALDLIEAQLQPR